MTADTFVLSFTHLKDRPNADRALHMLQRIASLVKPIMRKHGWRLPVLSEFFPESPNLLGLNINGGQKILVRLRPANSPGTFYDEEDVVQTMLHELTHNVHGPHDERFYKYLAGLQEEYDALQRSGYAGEGFFSEGKRLGAGVSHDVSPHLSRTKALEAAEKRRRVGNVLGGGGRVLGGAIGKGNLKGLSARELAARAAEQRVRDEKTCSIGDLAEKEAEKAATESVENKVIDLTLDSDEDKDDDDIIIIETKSKPTPIALAGPSSTKAVVSQSTKSDRNGSSRTLASRPAKKPVILPTPQSSLPTGTRRNKFKAQGDEWSCPACTLLNPPSSLQCDACLMRRPPDENAGWVCLTCGEGGMPHEFWTCRFCGQVKVTS